MQYAIVWENGIKMDELPKEYEELVNCYKIVQYNNVFDRKNRVDSVFDLN